jgi:hypothetical protein
VVEAPLPVDAPTDAPLLIALLVVSAPVLDASAEDDAVVLAPPTP